MGTVVVQEQDVIKRARDTIERKHGKTPEQLYEEREKRVSDAIALKEADRVPVMLRLSFFPLRYVEASPYAAFYEPGVYQQAVIKTLLDFEPDIYTRTNAGNSGLALEALEAKQVRWPGGNLPRDVMNQFVEMEIMKADEYDLFITDPTDFMIRYYLPRVYGALAPFSKLPTLGQRLSGFLGMTPVFMREEFRQVARILLKAGQEKEKFGEFDEGIAADLGFPPLTYPGGAGGAPFGFIATNLRGWKGIVDDMFERPEKLLTACERVLEWQMARAKPADPKKKWNPRRVGGGAAHWIDDRFFSRKQFETFVWPTCKKAILATIDMGFVVQVWNEGKSDDRLEYFLELPKGKILLWLDQVDMARAKSVLGNHCCIMGNIPPVLLKIGSPQEVEDYCKNLIKVCGKGGGFILATASTDEAKPENVKAMIESVKKYGWY